MYNIVKMYLSLDIIKYNFKITIIQLYHAIYQALNELSKTNAIMDPSRITSRQNYRRRESTGHR